jgi:hypothetical protein
MGAPEYPFGDRDVEFFTDLDAERPGEDRGNGILGTPCLDCDPVVVSAHRDVIGGPVDRLENLLPAEFDDRLGVDHLNADLRCHLQSGLEEPVGQFKVLVDRLFFIEGMLQPVLF